MTVQVRCSNPACGKLLQVPSEWLARPFACGQCRQIVTGSAPPPPPASPVRPQTSAPMPHATPADRRGPPPVAGMAMRPPAPPLPRQAPSTSRRWLWLSVVGGVAVVALALGGWLVATALRGERPSDAPTPVADRPAADLDQHALAAPPGVEGSVSSLAKYLIEPAKTERDKARVIFRWIAARIDYDVEAYLAKSPGDQSTAAVLKRRKAVCGGYVNVFNDLCREAGLESVFVGGYCKKNAEPGRKLTKPEHAWNAVKIDGTWRLVDCTFGAGHLNGGVFERRFSDFYFLTPPEQLIFSHFPEEERWQLLPTTLTLAQFQEQPLIDSLYFQYGLSTATIRATLADPGFRGLAPIFVLPDGLDPVIKEAPLEKQLRAGKTYSFRIEWDKEATVGVVNNGALQAFAKKGSTFEGTIAPKAGTLTLAVQPGSAGKGRFFVVMQYDVE